jgi:hypothetical protein
VLPAAYKLKAGEAIVESRLPPGALPKGDFSANPIGFLSQDESRKHF